MYILIANADPIGRSLAAQLIAHGHEVAYVDENAEYCNQTATELGCLVIHGQTTNINILKEAGIERADVVVALLEKDIQNIMLGIFARQFEVPQIMARLRQEHYRSAYELAGIKKVFSEFSFLQNQMLIAIEDPSVKQVMELGDGHTEIAALVINDQSPLSGKKVTDLWEHAKFPKGALVLGVLRATDQRFLLPRDAPVVRPGDDLLIIGTPDDIHQISRLVTQRRGW
jgi:trk system potassium uptake protein TrkA